MTSLIFTYQRKKTNMQGTVTVLHFILSILCIYALLISASVGTFNWIAMLAFAFNAVAMLRALDKVLNND